LGTAAYGRRTVEEIFKLKNLNITSSTEDAGRDPANRDLAR